MKLFSWGQKVEQGIIIKIDKVLEDEIEDHLQGVLLLEEMKHDLEDKTSEDIDSEGYMCSGDIGSMNKDGYLFITGW